MVSVARPGPLRALLYHRLEDPAARHPALEPDLVTASPALFERQLQHLVRCYHPIGADELTAAIMGRHTLPPRAVVVTFDDGYRDFMELAWPLLRRHHVPAILFVPTAFVDQPGRGFWWDALWQVVTRTRKPHAVLPGTSGRQVALGAEGERLEAWRTIASWLKTLTPAGRRAALEALIEQLGVTPDAGGSVLSWSALRQLQQAGVTIAAHSRTHELLDQLDAAALDEEVAGSRDDLVRELGTSPPVFAYPNGNFSAASIGALSRAGFEAAFSTVHGLSHPSRSHPLALRRDDGKMSLLRFALKLSGPVAALRTRRHPVPAYAEARWPAG